MWEAPVSANGTSVGLDVHARSVVVTAHELMERGAFTADELRARMDQVRERINRA